MKYPSIIKLFASILCLFVFAQASAFGKSCPKPDRQAATKALIKLVNSDSQLKNDLVTSIKMGQRINKDPQTNPVASLKDYYDFVDALVTYDPRNLKTTMTNEGIRISMDGKKYCNWNILDLLSYSYFLVDRQITTDPRGQIQFKNKKFSNWLGGLAEQWGHYLKSKDSAQYVSSEFINDPSFGKWYCPPDTNPPYKSFQAFFTRPLCPEKFPSGSRPVHGYNDPKTVVSIGDSNSMGTWPISQEGKVVTGYDTVAQDGMLIKGKLYSDIHDFIMGGDDETILRRFGKINPAIFNSGTFSHQFLNVNNYHRLHVPVEGKLVFMRHIKSGTRLKSNWKPAINKGDLNYYDPEDTPDWQFGQTRLVLGIKTKKYGTVIAVPMGMAQVSAIRLRKWVKHNAHAMKGWEFANFAFGGSDFVLLFQPKAKFRLAVKKEPKRRKTAPNAGVNYVPSLQGQKYGCFGGTTKCSNKPGNPPPIPK